LDMVRSAAMAALAVAMLASCGGGTQIEAFAPKRVIVFGDETSLVTVGDSAHLAQGRKYTVNGVEFFTDTSVNPAVVIPVSPTNPKCATNPIWTQVLASSYGFAFEECADSGTVVSQGVMAAKVDAKAIDLSQQVTLFMSGNNGTLASNDLVSVMAGMKDVIDLYESQPDPTTNSAALINAAGQAGAEVGAQVVRITDLGAKVIVSTIPDMGLSPYAANEEALHPGEGRAALLSLLSAELNTRLRLKLQDVRDGGRAVGLVLADDLVLSMYRLPLSFSLTNVVQGACTTPLPACDQTTTQDSVAGQSYGGYWLWADDRHLGPAAQTRLGSLAVTRARNNPF